MDNIEYLSDHRPKKGREYLEFMLKKNSELLCVNDIALLFSYLNQNAYNINTDVTKIMLKSSVQIKNLICFISK